MIDATRTDDKVQELGDLSLKAKRFGGHFESKGS
jgi:hypothetical protein